MSNIGNMDSVFANGTADDLEFDTIFDTEDSLIDTVAGVNESGDPITGVDFEDLHQTDDNASTKDVSDELGPNHDEKFGATNPEGSKESENLDVSVKGNVNKDSDADKFYGDADDDYQSQKDSTAKVDTDSVTNTIDKTVEEGCDDSSRDIDSELNDDGDDNDVVSESDRDIDAELNVDDDEDRDIDAELNGVDEAGSVKGPDDDEDSDIEKIANEKVKKKTSSDLSYGLEDEELIDLVSSGKA